MNIEFECRKPIECPKPLGKLQELPPIRKPDVEKKHIKKSGKK